MAHTNNIISIMINTYKHNDSNTNNDESTNNSYYQ